MAENNRNPFDRDRLGETNIELLQDIVDLLAEAFDIPTALITRVDGSTIEIFMASQTDGNPYKPGDNACFPGSGFYCEWAIKQQRPLQVPNALKDPEWEDNPGTEVDMIAYMGVPIRRPDGQMFGTICVLDRVENPFSETFFKLLDKFKALVESMLAEVYSRDQVQLRDEYLSQISKIFPICCYCKSIRDEHEQWIPVEQYIGRLSGKLPSHGICPVCFREHFGNDKL